MLTARRRAGTTFWNTLEARTNRKKAFLHGCELAGSCLRGTVLDTGAGIGWTSAIISRNPHVNVVYATDIGRSRFMRASAVFDVFGGDKSKLRLALADYTSLKLSGRSVDCIIMNGSFHHCYDKDVYEFLKECHRVLSDDGLIILSNEHYVDVLWSFK